MGSKYQNTVVGVFVLFGIAVMAGLVVAFGGGRTLFTDTYDLNVVFPQGVVGLQEGQGVTINGKRIGETRGIRFVDPRSLEKGVSVVVAVEGYELPAASEMLVAAPVMGLGKPLIQITVLDPADPRRIPMDGSGSITGRMLRNIDQLVPRQTLETLETATRYIGELAAALRPVAVNLSQLLEQRGIQQVDQLGIVANMATLVQRFDATLKSLNAIIGDDANRANLRDLLTNARKMSEAGVGAMQNLGDLGAQGKLVAQDLTLLLRRMTGLSEDMSTLVKHMDGVALAMNQKTGTVGLMLNDNRLYEEMLLTARRMTKMLDDMREVLDIAKKGQLKIKAF